MSKPVQVSSMDRTRKNEVLRFIMVSAITLVISYLSMSTMTTTRD